MKTAFASLIRRVQARGRKPGHPGRTIKELAESAKLSRQQFYVLMRGVTGARQSTIERLAKACGLTVRTFEDALREDARRREAAKK